MMCTLCGETPPTCEHCLGAMFPPPYSQPEQEQPQEQPKKFIGSGEDAHIFFLPQHD